MSQDGKRNSDSIASKLIAAGFPANLDGLRFSSALNLWEFAPFGGGGADHGCRIFHSVNQSVANLTVFTSAFDSENYDTDAYHDLVVNNSDITIPAGLAGKYLVGAGAQWDVNAVGTRLIAVTLNGVTNLVVLRFGADPTGFTTITSTGIFDLIVGDIITFRAFQDSGVALNINRVPEQSVVLWCQKVDSAG